MIIFIKVFGGALLLQLFISCAIPGEKVEPVKVPVKYEYTPIDPSIYKVA